MALGTHGDGYMFVSVANGKMNYKEGGEKKHADFFDGRLTGISLIQDEFEGNVTQKIELTMEDGTQKAKIKFTLEAWYSVGFFARIPKINLAEPFRLGVFGSEENEKVSFCFMKQGGAKVEGKKDIPKPENIQAGKKTVVDWTKFDEYAESVIAHVQAKLAHPQEPDVPAKPDDLPF